MVTQESLFDEFSKFLPIGLCSIRTLPLSQRFKVRYKVNGNEGCVICHFQSGIGTSQVCFRAAELLYSEILLYFRAAGFCIHLHFTAEAEISIS